ncbi:acetyl-CoA acetyltransferase [Kitasatospora herbaricolor]|uniref:acetyl-CoA C-acetyltransferase n=1 Tax=Kitasatospora herbaricolor TaxID=68217 RepID=UPI00174C4E0C|nr:acetyl-CoA C-acetyltransferase [Kitasatospora herbaricolor]MDQ0311529.1 acetyl-CoA C-acetyltransferase [Kitasatospora herbaricolor]GGU94988.1 acetyl-CoA acetyltransferase [Kitasatospora herbaricolor]
MTRTVRRVAIIGGNRIPFARAAGPYAQASNQEMLGAALDGLVERYGLAGVRLGEFAAGAVLKHARDFNLAREVVLGSRLDPRTPAYDLQQACGTGLETVALTAAKIALGQSECAVAGGVDTVSDAPIGLNDDLRRLLLKVRHAPSAARRVGGLLAGLRPGQLRPDAPANSEPRTGLSMGEHAAVTALEWGIGRTEQDELAAASHRRLHAAYERGFFDDLVTPYRGLTRDQNLRPDSTVERLARLKPVFGEGLRDPFGTRPGAPAGATMTAGNSTPLSDGASVVLLASEDWAAARGLTPLAYLVDTEVAAVDFVTGRDGLLTAPVFAVPRLLARNGLTFADLDRYEIHEAFASQVLATLKAWEDEAFCVDRLGLPDALGPLDRARLNVTGSSLAAGHPFAATGGRITATLAKLLHELRADAAAPGRPVRGLISVCAAGGQGIAALLEA